MKKNHDELMSINAEREMFYCESLYADVVNASVSDSACVK